MSGMSMEGIWLARVTRDVVEESALPSVMFVMTLTRNSVPPEPIILTATPVRMMSVFRMKAKKPIRSGVRMPGRMATSTPRAQDPVQ